MRYGIKAVLTLLLGLLLLTTLAACEKAPCEMHTYGEWAETVAATCAAEGEEARSCQACGYTDTRAIPMRAHTRVTMEVFVAATCEKEG